MLISNKTAYRCVCGNWIDTTNCYVLDTGEKETEYLLLCEDCWNDEKYCSAEYHDDDCTTYVPDAIEINDVPEVFVQLNPDKIHVFSFKDCVYKHIQTRSSISFARDLDSAFGVFEDVFDKVLSPKLKDRWERNLTVSEFMGLVNKLCNDGVEGIE